MFPAKILLKPMVTWPLPCRNINIIVTAPHRVSAEDQWRRSSPGSALPSPAYWFASVIVKTKNKNVTISDRFICFIALFVLFWRWNGVGGLCYEGDNWKKVVNFFLRKNVHPGDLAGGFSDLEMTWFLYCAGAPTAEDTVRLAVIVE